MKLWLDDVRVPTLDWVWVKTVEDAKAYLTEYGDEITLLSLDHDLGPGGEVYDLVKWMAEHGVWPAGDIYIHSANPVGVVNMRATIERYGPYDLRPDGKTLLRRDSDEA